MLDQKVTEKFPTDIIATLAELWPATFEVYGHRRRPLKLGIDHDLVLTGAVTKDEVKLALRFYCANIGYAFACKEGADRIDLDGKPAGKVTAEEAAHGVRIIEKWRRRQKAKADKPRRIGLADLRAAAQARKQSTKAKDRAGTENLRGP